ncbi:FAD-dependent oxidoreductase [Clostridium sp. MCC353]|uniref:FAD-dependent oxidoreductase n=1 Tax=Clostridium sp. MCC353 TaxID=2592646 RepID=UPI001C03224A|nr:FAD-dependent oxidoreductase [Clostridium sp. MCC353]MBT9778449.1 FAD-dependent oxidoreductase [Clostridium sp. MCC353]
MNKLYDIAVAGGGLAGTFAAIAAAREGKTVLLIEKNGFLGGSLTACGVGPMMTAHAGEKQIIKGLFEEMVVRMMRGGYSCGHIKDTTRYVSYITPFSSEGMKLVLDEMTSEADCRVLFHTSVAQADCRDGKITSLTICNKDGLSKVKAVIYIDATGDGDLAWMAGAPMQKGRPEDGQCQPMTLNMKYSNVNRELLKAYLLDHLDEFPRLKENRRLLEESNHLAVAGFADQLQKAVKNGEIRFPREELLFFETDRQGEFIVNTTRITGCDGTDAQSLSDSEREGRRQCAQLDRFMRREVPGFAEACLEFTGPSVGVRGSRQLKGKYELTTADILAGKMFGSRIALAAYPVDVHSPDGAGTDSCFEMGENGYYSIPFEVMFCDEISNLLVTGRCVSASFEAQAAIRTTPTTSAMGQAAGTAAALALECGVGPAELDIQRLQKKLKEGNVVL